MISAKNNATVVVLKMASTGMVLSFLQHKNGSLSQGDESSATSLLKDIKATVADQLKRIQATLGPILQIETLLAKMPGVKAVMPEDLKAKLTTARARVGEVEAMRKNMVSDIGEIDKLLEFAHLYDKADEAQLPEAGDDVHTEAMIETLLDQIFPQFGNAGVDDYTPETGDLAVGCGTPGCKGCGGRKLFQISEDDKFGGLFSLGTVKVPAQTDPARGDLPEELKAIFGDNVHVIKVGGQRGSDPFQGLGEMLQAALRK